jgi:putative DNA primase/helicase
LKANPDMNDTLREEGTEGVRARMDCAQKYEGNGKADEHSHSVSDSSVDGTIDILGKMSPAQYGAQRQTIADKTGISLKYLDTEYDTRRKAAKDESRKSIERSYWQVEPASEPVDGAALIDQIERRLKRHVVMKDEAALAVALWTAFAWAHDTAVHSPILLVSSPEAECGKSTLLGLVNFLVPKGLIIVEVSPAVLYRMIECWHPTLIVDEADTAFKNNPELRAVVNAGWTRGAGAPRCNPDTHEPEFFETFGPKAIGLKGLKVPDTTLSRSIIIEMSRKLPGDSAESFAHKDDDELADIRQQLARFSADNVARLQASNPQMPEGFTNRLEANWRPLLAVAEICDCACQGRKAATALSRRADEASLGVELLRDVRDILEGRDRIRSEELVQNLQNMHDRPWAEMPFTNKPITQLQLARMLKCYGVRPEQVRFDALTFKGYMRERFETAFRYIPDDHAAPTPEKRGNTETTADFCEKRGNILAPVVSVKMAGNSECFPVSPDRGGPGGCTPEDKEPSTRTPWRKDEFSCLKSGEPTLMPRGTK